MAKSRRARRRAGGARRKRGGVWVGRFVIGGLVLGAVLVLGGYFWFHSYLRSEGFRLMVNGKVGEKLEVTADFDKFVWDGMEVHAPTFRASGDDMISGIELEGLQTEVRFAPLLRKRVETQEIHARRMNIDLDVTKEGPQFDTASKKAFKFSSARIDDFSGSVDFGSSKLRWDDIQAKLTPARRTGYDAVLTRGKLFTPLSLFPALDLSDAKISYSDKVLYVKEGDWKVYESGRLETDGSIDFVSGLYRFNGEVTDVQCHEVLPEDWVKKLSGVLSASFSVDGAGKSVPLVKGDILLDNGILKALPVLDRISAYTLSDRFRTLALEHASLKFEYQGDRLKLWDIVLSSDGLMRIEGAMVIQGDEIDGDFRLGVTPQMIAHIPGATEKVFKPGESGLHWTPVKVWGTQTLPQEDLSKRLIAAGIEWMYEVVDGRLVLRNSGRLASDVARGIWSTTSAAAKIGAELLEKGTNLIPDNLPLPNPLDVINGILGNTTREEEKERGIDPVPAPPDGARDRGEEENSDPPQEEERPRGLNPFEEGLSILDRARKLLDPEEETEEPEENPETETKQPDAEGNREPKPEPEPEREESPEPSDLLERELGIPGRTPKPKKPKPEDLLKRELGVGD